MIRNANKFEKEAQCSTWDLAYKSLHGTKFVKSQNQNQLIFAVKSKDTGWSLVPTITRP